MLGAVTVLLHPLKRAAVPAVVVDIIHCNPALRELNLDGGNVVGTRKRHLRPYIRVQGCVDQMMDLSVASSVRCEDG